MDDTLWILQIVCFSIAAICLSVVSTYHLTKNEFQQEAFDRGFMVECVGKPGYHWECE